MLLPGGFGETARKATEQVPLPGAVVLFGSGLCGIIGMVVRRQGLVKRQDFGAGASALSSEVTRSCVIGLVSPDRVFAADLERQLQRSGYQFRAAFSVVELLESARHRPPVLVLIDRRVQDWEMLRTEPTMAHIPILTLIPQDVTETEEEIVADLERGADGVYSCRDGHRLFLAVVGAYCRRAGHDFTRRGVYQIGDIYLDADTRELTIAGESVRLSAKQFAILQVFMSAPSKVFAREDLIGQVWGPGFAIGEHTLDVHIHALRKLLSRDTDHGCEIVAIKGVGFKLKVRHSSESTGRAIESLSRMAFAKSVQHGELLDLLKAQRRRAEAPVKAETASLKRASRRNRFRALSRNNRRPSATQCRAW
ncbi:MAG: response regulator transcription factor [Nitrospira sp.]|nr:response regulator transcription factor [Nitrospira sp.]